MFERLAWQNGHPFSERFGDVYADQDVLAEREHVYLLGNGLEKRWRSAHREVFCIGELGFGLGVNFFLCWQRFLASSRPFARLHFISSEAYPLCRDDLFLFWRRYPNFQNESEDFLAQYHSLSPGVNRLVFAQGRIHLTLLIGDAVAMWSVYHPGMVNAWFLDGFSPKKNPEMWQDALWHCLARCHIPFETTCTTYSSAGWVRRSLERAGFSVERLSGFSGKRHMTRGVWVCEKSNFNDGHPPWFSVPPTPQTHSAVVVGAGISGACTARSLAERGWHVDVLEQHAGVAEGASSNPQGVFHLKVTPHDSPWRSFNYSAYGFSLRQSDALRHACGVLHLAQNATTQEVMCHAAQQERHKDLCHWVTAKEASNFSGVALSFPGLFFPRSGWIHPRMWVEYLLDHPNIAVHLKHQVHAIHYREDVGYWSVSVKQMHEPYHTDCLILATHQSVAEYPVMAHLPIRSIRGQMSLAWATEMSRHLRCVLCGDHYMTPVCHGRHSVGASFHHDWMDEHASYEEQRENKQAIHCLLTGGEYSPIFPEDLSAERVGFRASTPDRFPLLGPVARAPDFLSTYEPLRRDRTRCFQNDCPWWPGLYVHAGHGARGLSSAPLCAEYLATMICHEPSPLMRSLDGHLYPTRFLVRQLYRGS